MTTRLKYILQMSVSLHLHYIRSVVANFVAISKCGLSLRRYNLWSLSCLRTEVIYGEFVVLSSWAAQPSTEQLCNVATLYGSLCFSMCIRFVRSTNAWPAIFVCWINERRVNGLQFNFQRDVLTFCIMWLCVPGMHNVKAFETAHVNESFCW